MNEDRLVAFTDGVIAIIITVMVLEFHAPHSASFGALWELRHEFIIYLASFLTLAVYWVNHHHLFSVVNHVSAPVLWANMLALLAMSFYPFATAWMGTHKLTALAPAVFYGVVNLFANSTWVLLTQTLIWDNHKQHEKSFLLRQSRNKAAWSVLANSVGIAGAFIWPPLVLIIDMLTIASWFIPDRRIERHLAQTK
ncbi:TMEM175 family protein [Lacticaseibacillus pabuli]|uniref:TMEM175 family protein n=1 Tax=Lacticaseibacillus pabuli TaxID=3025672 RepID=A0ABY7WQ21_9LACO|nr:TMEM175 family protein [Lacticaseibacillus sp. KACC 23028]WDF82292.1 TMEM175 family protein [Lacticaseibacillus sp. KACC 23028]